MTDLKLMTQNEVAAIQSVIAGQDRPLLIIAEEVAPACVISLLSSHEKGGPTVAAIHPPDYGHWRKSMLDDIAIMTGRRVIARDLGGRIDHVTLRDLGAARQVRISANQTVISAGGGDPVAIGARREQVMRQVEDLPRTSNATSCRNGWRVSRAVRRSSSPAVPRRSSKSVTRS